MAPRTVRVLPPPLEDFFSANLRNASNAYLPLHAAPTYATLSMDHVSDRKTSYCTYAQSRPVLFRMLPHFLFILDFLNPALHSTRHPWPISAGPSLFVCTLSSPGASGKTI